MTDNFTGSIDEIFFVICISVGTLVALCPRVFFSRNHVRAL